MAKEYEFLDHDGLLTFSTEMIKTMKANSGTKFEPTNLIVTEVNDSSDDLHVASAKALNTLIKNTKTEAKRYTNQMSSNLETLIDRKANKSDVYTKQETDDRIKGVINSAPEALDTLKELADALGNDANFAATMTAELAKKINTDNAVTKTYYEIDKLRLKSTLDSFEFNLNKKLEKSVYDNDKRQYDTTKNQVEQNFIALVDLQNKIGKKADKNGFDFAKNFSLYSTDHPVLTKEIIDKPDYPQSYMGSINFGTQVGLPGNFVKILYIPHASDGYGTQIAICYDGGIRYGIHYRNAFQKEWRDWIEILDSRRANGHENYIGTTAPDNDADKCLVSGRPVYCHYNVTQHLPLGVVDDGIIIPFIHRTDVLYGFQLFMSWNTYAIYWRVASNNTWGKWFCIGGGSWDQQVEKDSPQVMKYMRWENYGKNHIIFDASKSIRPDGQPCDRINSNQPWHNANCPTLMAFNGGQTWGVRVDSARTTDQVLGFPFRNTGGVLEVLMNNVWVKVGGGGGGMQYTVLRQGDATNQDYNYSGGPGIIRSITGWATDHSSWSNLNPMLTVIIDGVQVTPYFLKAYGGDIHNRLIIMNHDLEFKQSVTIKNIIGYERKMESVKFIIQTAN